MTKTVGKLVKYLCFYGGVAVVSYALSSLAHTQSNKTTPQVQYSINYVTRVENLNMQERQSRVELYRAFLKDSDVQEVENLPFDLLRQNVYDKLSDKKEVFTVNLFSLESEVTEPTWKDCFNKIPRLQFTGVTSESQVPQYVLDNLTFGYHYLVVDDKPSVLEVVYSDVDLTNWETVQSAITNIREVE